MTIDQARKALQSERSFLMKIVAGFKPEEGDFAPVEGMMSVAQQIRHIADTVNWFRRGAFEGEFNMDFTALEARLREEVALEEAVAELNAAYDGYDAFLRTLESNALGEPMAMNPILGAAPRSAAITAQADHTAHHRGALTVYLRLLGRKPEVIYAI